MLQVPRSLRLQKHSILTAPHICVFVFLGFERFDLFRIYFSRKASGNFVGTFRVLRILCFAVIRVAVFTTHNFLLFVCLSVCFLQRFFLFLPHFSALKIFSRTLGSGKCVIECTAGSMITRRQSVIGW